MDGNSRILNRIRPRPYDLRRKVLLKNFLREQMTYIPPVRSLINTSMEESLNNDASPEVTTSIGNEENMETSDDQPMHAQSDEVFHSEPSTSTDVNEIEPNTETSISNASLADNILESDKAPQSKFSKLSTLLRLKSASRKKKKRGICKAKHNYKSIKSPIKLVSQLPDAKKNLGASVRSKKSFFELFKFRRGARKMAYSKKDMQCSSSNELSNKTSATSDQSIQTDISLLNETYNSELEQTNKNLQEENRLLSESLSYIMSDISFKLNSKKKSFECTDSYSNTSISDCKIPTNHEEQNSVESKNCNFERPEMACSNTKLLRSKSVQEKYSSPKIRLRTRGNVLAETPKITFNVPPKLPGFRDSYANKPQNNGSASDFSPQTVLKNLPINSSKTIVRRSSMPERTYREPIRTLLRTRSNSIRVIGCNSDRKRNQDASCSYSVGAFVSKKQALANVRKPILRRSSMPERISRSHCRPVHRYRSINNHDFSRVPNTPYSRPSSVGEYSRSASLQNLPNEAFY